MEEYEKQEIHKFFAVFSKVFLAIFLPIAFVVILFAILLSIQSCSPKIIEHVKTEIEYRDRIVHDTTTFEITKEVEKIITRDSSSHLENRWAVSDAVVSEGYLTHTLESKPQIIEIPVEVHVTDTLWKESQVVTETKYIEKELNWWQKFRLNGFWWLLGAVVALLLWIFRKPLLKLFAL